MNRSVVLVVCLLSACLLLATCAPTKPPEIEHPERHDPNPLTVPDDLVPAEWIASAGHGAVFDHAGEPIELTDELLVTIQGSMIDELQKAGAVELDRDAAEAVQNALERLETEKLTMTDRGLLQGAVIAALLRRADDRSRNRYLWRHRIILSRYWERYRSHRDLFSPWYRELLESLQVRNAFTTLLGGEPEDDYIARCRAADVPVPPPWAESSVHWQYHGELAEKLILAGIDAHVWTWADPHRRGGCIALPRGDGAPGSAAGIICQSASTGSACFWDNIEKGQTAVLGWSGLTLDVADLRDGDTLNGCLGCHLGSNVFNISPDDATWAKVIRTSPTSTIGATFTTRIENPAVPRYVPISNQSSWVNSPASPCIGCHERPAVGFSPPAVMPPACRTGISDPSGCYR